MVTNEISDFSNCVDESPKIKGTGGTTKSPGFGIIVLQVVLTNGTTRDIETTHVRYMPQCPVKLFSLKRFWMMVTLCMPVESCLLMKVN